MTPTPTPTLQPKLRTFLTNAQKLQLKAFWGAHPDLQLVTVVDWVREHFGVTVGRATLYRIYHSPAAAFAGNAQQKKGRRVKFPALDRDVLQFYKAYRQRHRDSDAGLPDDVLLSAAAELRARHGIAESELKLSNGWLHRFKERHALRVVPQARGYISDESNAMDGQWQDEAASEGSADATLTSKGKRKRKPRAPQRSLRCQSSCAPTDSANGAVETQPIASDAAIAGGAAKRSRRTTKAASPSDSSVTTSENKRVPAGDSSVATSPTAIATPTGTTTVQPLTYLSANAAGSTSAVGFVNWTQTSGTAHVKYFAVENDCITILRTAVCQLNVDLQHSALPSSPPAVIFKVWGGTELLGQCERCVRSQGDRALSVLQLKSRLPAQTEVRVEYHAPGVVFRDSRLVLRLLDQ
ncbi:hypothetical protein BBJ28_00008948 [Nothophytophthora sp. Chile5]|nr:hypothetical protein BBJ28_00008948 [Nothophytophthora sp. Chile5]